VADKNRKRVYAWMTHRYFVFMTSLQVHNSTFILCRWTMNKLFWKQVQISYKLLLSLSLLFAFEFASILAANASGKNQFLYVSSLSLFSWTHTTTSIPYFYRWEEQHTESHVSKWVDEILRKQLREKSHFLCCRCLCLAGALSNNVHISKKIHRIVKVCMH
jgi:hypothetical protein